MTFAARSIILICQNEWFFLIERVFYESNET